MPAIRAELNTPAQTVLTATSPGARTPSRRMACTTKMPKARPASASIVL